MSHIEVMGYITVFTPYTFIQSHFYFTTPLVFFIFSFEFIGFTIHYLTILITIF